MKRQYTKPEAHEESFRANKFVATCDPGSYVWEIECDVPQGYGFVDTNGNGKRDNNEKKIASGSGCGTSHTTTLPAGETPQKNAMWQPQEYHSTGFMRGEYVDVGDPYPVFYFQATNQHGGWGSSNHHFSISATQGEGKNLGQPS